MDNNQEKQIETKEPLSKSDFYFNTPLYEVFKYSEIEDGLFSGTVEGYNNHQECDTTFNISNQLVESYGGLKNYRSATLTCKRYGTELQYFIFDITTNNDERIVMKIGQFPSLADISEKEVDKKYLRNIEDRYLRPFKKAIGLASHGVGAGSFVYLRKIFEDLILETFNNNSQKHNLKKEDFKKLRMAEKVEKLRDYLPEQVIKMKSLYGIMSNGVHTLSEQKCLEYFPAIKLAIEVIWDEQIEKKNKDKRTSDVENEIQRIKEDLK